MVGTSDNLAGPLKRASMSGWGARMKQEFREWMEGRGFDPKTVSTQMSQFARLERYFGNLDKAFDEDRFEAIRSRLAYTKEDERSGRPNPAPFAIQGDVYSNLSSYRTTLNYYSDFRTGAGTAPESAADPSGLTAHEDHIVGTLVDLLVRQSEPPGFIEYDTLDRALPQTDLTAAQIDAVIKGLERRGIQIVESEEPAALTLPVAPPGYIAVDGKALEAMRRTFVARFPDFESIGFAGSAGRYWETERGYKQRLIDAAANQVARSDLEPADLGLRLLRILEGEPSNLLGWREWRRIREVQSKAPIVIEQALGKMVRSEGSLPDRVARCIEEIAPAYLDGQEGSMPYAHLRTLPTTALALARPREAIAVRYKTIHRAAVRLLGAPLFRNGPMTAQEYAVVLALARHVEDVMRNEWGWGPRDLWDVQGFLWVVTETDAEWGGSAPQPSPTSDPEPIQDRYRTQADDPAMVDALEREPFAAVLAARIVEIRKSERTEGPEGDRAFMVHLHGPWGSGKSSILNLLRRDLEHPKEGEASLVVMFNAWKQQRMRPPWWALMNGVYRRSMDPRRAWTERLSLWRTWWSWRWKAEMLPITLVAILVTGLTFAIFSADTRGLVEPAVKIAVAATAALAGVYAYARIMIFGSKKAVQTYADLTTDPYRRIVKLFNRLVSRIKAPLVVFIDDLDRCDSDYVVELLEGIQTLFRHAPVTYVIAADRKWICSSFEKKYADFAVSVGEPCRPLGYLFLDKLFQISAEMPRLNREVQANYLAALLREESPAKSGPSSQLIAEAEERVSGISNEAELQQLIAEEEAQAGPGEAGKESLDRQRALRHAAALQITSVEAAADTEHRLQKLSHLLEPNPRSMKRLVNAVGMAQARGILEGRWASPETRARWAMLSLRWPLLADFIADNPDAIAHWRKPAAGEPAKPVEEAWPLAVKTLDGDRNVMDVVGGQDDEGALTPDSLAPLIA